MEVSRRTAVLSLASLAAGCSPFEKQYPLTIAHLPSGLRFGMVGGTPGNRAPTLFNFATDVETSLVTSNAGFGQVPQVLAPAGVLSVTIDLPCYGLDTRGGEPIGLPGWATRVRRGDDPMRELTVNATKVLDYLVTAGLADDRRVAASGISRGGFCGLHFAATDPRVKAVAALSPVTTLSALTEFKDVRGEHDTIPFGKLAGRSIWVSIADNDDRVGTKNAEALVQMMRSLPGNARSDVELHLIGHSGHIIEPAAFERAGAWLLTKLGIPPNPG